MKKITLPLILLVAALASNASSEVKPGFHENFTTVFVGDTGSFRTFAIVNEGAARVWVRFAYDGNTPSDLETDSISIPPGRSWTPPPNGDIGRTARAYWLSSTGSTASVTYD